MSRTDDGALAKVAHRERPLADMLQNNKDTATMTILRTIYRFNYPLFLIRSAVVIALSFSALMVFHELIP